jgi:hypothetical protein
MAKQDSILPIRGSLGDVTYFKREGKYFCKRKNAVSLQQVRSDEAFAPFRRQSQVAARCITLAAAIYKLVPVDKRNGKLYRSMIKWMCKPHHRSKDLDAIIIAALDHFNFMESEFPLPEKEECIRQIRSALPFTTLIPEEVPATPAPKPPSEKKSGKNISLNKDISINKDLLTLITAIQQLTTVLAEKLIDY